MLVQHQSNNAPTTIRGPIKLANVRGQRRPEVVASPQRGRLLIIFVPMWVMAHRPPSNIRLAPLELLALPKSTCSLVRQESSSATSDSLITSIAIATLQSSTTTETIGFPAPSTRGRFLSLIFLSGEAACSNNATGDDPVQALERKPCRVPTAGLWDARSCHEAGAYPRWINVSPAMLTPIIALVTIFGTFHKNTKEEEGG
jgi:hypothetical protein